MRIAIAQIKSVRGDIEENIKIHIGWIHEAIAAKVDFIVFPELSLTAYEPTLAGNLAMDKDDVRLAAFQQISNWGQIAIGVGLPLQSATGVQISLGIFQAHREREFYSKQILHSDELPFFTEGQNSMAIRFKDACIAPAICYESLQKSHFERAINLGANIYVASVAKPQRGIEKAFEYFPSVAREHGIPVLMANSIGYCDTFMAVGQSAIWDSSGNLVDKLSTEQEGLLIFDSEEGRAERVMSAAIK
jgi:predicted amidohydrolase